MNREQMLLRLSAVQFALWECHVFLDTHRGDPEVMKMHENYKQKYQALLEEFEKQFGPINLTAENSDLWLENPWPWDIETQEDC